jgi:ABC-type antimicrobial peptide transport system permease subunit
MKFLPLIWAGLRRKPAHPILTFVSMTMASLLAGLTMTANHVLPQGPGRELDKAVTAVAGAGFVMILFLTANAMAQAVRERGWEFALLRTLGFRGWCVVILLFCEVALPCLTGAAAGQGLAQLSLLAVSFLLPPQMKMTLVLPPAAVRVSFAAAAFVPFLSMILPARRLLRLNLAATLAGGRHG